MKVNFITFHIDLTAGGIQNTGFLLAGALNKQQGISMRLFTDERSSVPPNTDVVRAISKGRWGKAYAMRVLKALFHHRAPDVNLCVHWYCAVPCLFYKLLTHTPYAVMVHGNEILKNPHRNLKVVINENVRKAVMNHACVIFSNSMYTKNVCMNIFDNKNVSVIHGPVSEESTSSLESMNSGKTNILFSIGRHVERKGFQDVIRAMPELRRMYPQIRYRLAGDGPFHSELVELTRELGLEDCVEFLGRISEEQKREELQKCDLFIMTSHTDEDRCEVEGFGICYLEANAHGKWVIARDSGGVSDAVLDGVTGYLLPNSDVDTICEAVDRFYSSCTPDISELKRWARLHSPESIAKQYVEVLKNYA